MKTIHKYLPDLMNSEFVTARRSRDELLDQMRAFVEDAAEHNLKSACVSFGWDSNLEFEEMWKPHSVDLRRVVDMVLDAESKEIVCLGQSDIFVEAGGTTLVLCHESDLHVRGEGALVEKQVARWKSMGFSPISTIAKE